MKLEIKIDSANAALVGDNAPHEVARILNQLAERIEQGDGAGETVLRDINGNSVGYCDFEPEPDPDPDT